MCYQRVAPHRSSLPPSLEPLALPRSSLLLPGHALLLLLLLAHSLVHLAMAVGEEEAAVLVVAVVVVLQEVVCLLLTLVTCTDTGLLCPGLALTRWFLHTDFYTQVTPHTSSCYMTPCHT